MADFGPCDLKVIVDPGIRVYVVSEVADAFPQLMGGRVSSQKVSPSGEVRFSPLPEGRYDVGIDQKGIFATVAVEANGLGTEVELPK